MSEHQHHHHHSESSFRRFLRTYGFEIIWLTVVALGVFLVFERLSIRAMLSGWLSRGGEAALYGLGHLDQTAVAVLARTTLSDAIGAVLVLGALIAIFLRVRWRVMHNPALAVLRCPQCNGVIHRTHRRASDRLISSFVPMRRYSCSNDQCRWRGLRVGTGHGESRASVHESL